MLYSIRHVTSYLYGAEVSSARCMLHLVPASTSRQRVVSTELMVDPLPQETVTGIDFFGNHTRYVRIAAPSERHRFEARCRLEVLDRAWPQPEETLPWEEIRRLSQSVHDLERTPTLFLFPSRHVPLLAAARAYAQRSFTPGRPVLAGVVELMRRIHAEFRYDPQATDISTPLDVVGAQRHGVCQDFAHWMIAGLRSLGIPARYVSGYLRTVPPPGQPRLVGADATHAWVEAWCGPGAGWIELDPTNAVLPALDHVRLAIGRDYADIAPVGGVVSTSASHLLSVSVDVEPLSEDGAAGQILPEVAA